MASHAEDDGFHEIQLNGKQLVFVFMATTVVLVVTFLCGVLVGRGVRAQRPEVARVEEPPAVDQLKNAVDPLKPPTVNQREDPTKAPPPAPAEGGDGSSELASDTSGDATAAASADQAARALARPAATGAAARAARAEGTPQQQAGAAAKSPESKPADRVARAPAVAAPRTAATPESTDGETSRSIRQAASPTATDMVASKTSPSAGAVAIPAPDDARRGWVVQVAATKTRGEADTIARRLTSKGYSAFVLSSSANVFRVRVGAYKSKRDADSVAARLRKEERVNPWVTR
ncbi:MAG: SPOR domain-containing protein [Vicinamibacterales bacterium]